MRSFIILSLFLFCSAKSEASPWLVKKGTYLLSGQYDFARATQEFISTSGKRVDYSLQGIYSSNTYTLGARVGVTDLFEIDFDLPFKSVTYTADPVLLITPLGESFDEYQENILNFSNAISGIADIQLRARFALLRGSFAASLEMGLTAPTGYTGPSGTFGEDPNRVDDFQDRVDDIVKPENIKDDITLGDGVFGFIPRLNFGFGSASGFFTRGSIGLNIRNQDAGDFVVSSFKIGQFIRPWLLLYGGAALEYTIIPGRVIGISVIANDPSLPASEYGGTNNLQPIEVRLDRDQLQTPIGLLFRPLNRVNFTLTYSPVIWGRNVAMSHTLSAGFTLQSDL